MAARGRTLSLWLPVCEAACRMQEGSVRPVSVPSAHRGLRKDGVFRAEETTAVSLNRSRCLRARI